MHARGGLGLALVLAVLACGCSVAATGSGRSIGAITRADVFDLTGGTGSALSVVRQLRPRWLRARNPGQPSSGGRPLYAEVFLDQIHLGPLSELDGVSAQIVQRIEYLDMRDATIRYGEGYPGGIIRVVTSRTGSNPTP